MAAFEIYQAAQKSQYYRVVSEITEVPKYGRGRPSKTKPRPVLRYEYMVKSKVIEIPDKIEFLRAEAGCFVLLTNLCLSNEMRRWKAVKVLIHYKYQSGIEQNHGFLKDPAIINAIFLKKATRIEVLGFVPLVALLIWRLMERAMRLDVSVAHGEAPFVLQLLGCKLLSNSTTGISGWNTKRGEFHLPNIANRIQLT